ncbi:MAG: hypothetical protein WCE68_02425 [Anaerolineales bacterium]
MSKAILEKRIRYWIIFFMIALSISGLTAIPLVWEVTLLHDLLGPGTAFANIWPAMSQWVLAVYTGITATARDYPFMLYGTDWLAFAHVVIAIAFIGPLRDPLRNRWVIEFGMIACILIIPWGIIFGAIRGIPPFWSVIDFSFGIFGLIPLWLVRKYILQLAKQ